MKSSKLYYTEIMIKVLSDNPAQIKDLEDLEYRVQGENDVRRIDVSQPIELKDKALTEMICNSLLIKPTHFTDQGKDND